MKKFTLVERPKFCPIGVVSNVRMLPTSFVKVCLANQERTHSFNNAEVASYVHKAACSTCEAAASIREGIDPTLVVADVGWITEDELFSIQSSLRSIIVKMSKIPKTSKSDRIMKNNLLRIKTLLTEIDEILSESIGMLEKKSETKVVAAPVAPKSINPFVEKVEIIDVEKIDIAAEYLRLREEEKLSGTRIGEIYGKSKNYINKQIKRYVDSLPKK